MTTLIVAGILAIVAIIVVIKTAVIVPQQSAYVVENLGKYSRTLQAGFHILVPFIERVAYRHTLKEYAIDVEEQICITSDNVQVGVDGVLYLQVMEARNASYGIGDYLFAIAQLAQTTLRSEIGKIELDKTFEERSHINLRVVEELDQASNPWGVKVLRYEIRNINPPADVLTAMEKHRINEKLSDFPADGAPVVLLFQSADRREQFCLIGATAASMCARSRYRAGSGRSLCSCGSVSAVRRTAIRMTR